MSKPKQKRTEESQARSAAAQLERFKSMAAEVGADETPNALDRSFGRIDPKPKKPAKAK